MQNFPSIIQLTLIKTAEEIQQKGKQVQTLQIKRLNLVTEGQPQGHYFPC